MSAGLRGIEKRASLEKLGLTDLRESDLVLCLLALIFKEEISVCLGNVNGLFNISFNFAIGRIQ